MTMATENARGTPSYRAPELLAEVSTFSNFVDIWGLGCILYEITVKKKAFSNDWSVREYAVSKSKIIVPLDDTVESEIRIPLTNLIHEMLRVNPRARPSAQDLKVLFTMFVENIPMTDGSPLLSKISRSLSADDEPDLVHMYHGHLYLF